MKVLAFRINSFQPTFRQCLGFSAVMAWVIPIILGLMVQLGLPQLYRGLGPGKHQFYPMDLATSDPLYRMWDGLNIAWHNSMIFMIDFGGLFVILIMLPVAQWMGNSMDAWLARRKGRPFSINKESETMWSRVVLLSSAVLYLFVRFGHAGSAFGGDYDWKVIATLVLPHGVLELFAISFAGALFLYFGSRYTVSGTIDNLHNVSQILRARWALKVIGVGFGILVISGLIEGVITTGLYENLLRNGETVFPGKKLF